MNEQELQDVMEWQSTLGAFGFIGKDAPQDLEKQRLQLAKADLAKLTKIEAIMRTVPQSRRISPRSSYSSYGLKHIIERIIGEYVSNGELIAVCLHLGFQHRVYGPNCTFNVPDKEGEKLKDMSRWLRAWQDAGVFALPARKTA